MSSAHFYRLIGSCLSITIVLAQPLVDPNLASPRHGNSPRDTYQHNHPYPFRGYSPYYGPEEDAWLYETAGSFPTYPAARAESAQWDMAQFAPSRGMTRIAAYPFADSLNPQWIRSFGTGRAPGDDRGVAIAVDHEGNIYTTGATIRPPHDWNIITFKYSPEGTELWRAEYDGAAHRDDYPRAIAVDNLGYIFIGGMSHGGVTGHDFVILKYDSQGGLMWEARYSGPRNMYDMLGGIVPDNQGGVYAGGTADMEFSQYAAMRIDSLGNEVWSAQYGEPRHVTWANIAVDPWGNLYQSGTYWDDESGRNVIVTIKRKANGDLAWVAEYASDSLYYASVHAVATDVKGNVYVVGRADGEYPDYGMFTLKYDSTGAEQWFVIHPPAHRYDTGKYVRVDDSGFVYVSGYQDNPGTDYDWVTVKYSPFGEELWTATYNHPDDGSDNVTGMVLDSYGNVYVTGMARRAIADAQWITIKYDSAGEVVWQVQYARPAVGYGRPGGVALGLNGEVYVTGTSRGSTSGDDITTVAYSAQGAEQWVIRYNGAAYSHDIGRAVVTDRAGQVYVVAESHGVTTEILLNKYSPTGDLLWSNHYAGLTNSGAGVAAMAAGTNGNIYLAGSTANGTSGPSDYLVMQYSPDGNLNWAATHDSPGNSQDRCVDLALDPAGDAYMIGHSYDLHAEGWVLGSTNAIMKYSSAGDKLWVEQYQRPGDEDGLYPVGMAVDRSGVYIAGNTHTDLDDYGGGHQDITTLKYSSSGSLQWDAHYNGSQSHNDMAIGVGLDGQGNVIVNGWSDDPYRVIVTIKYGNNGSAKWIDTYTDVEQGYNRPHQLAVDFLGNVYIKALCEFDLKILKYTGSGRLDWVRDFSYPNTGAGRMSGFDGSLVVDGYGAVYVSGRATKSSDAGLVVISKYSTDGDVLWTDAYSSASYVKDTPEAMAVDGWGGLYLAASSGGGPWGTVTVLKYLETGRVGIPGAFSFAQNFPNPFNSSTTFRFILNNEAYTTLKVFNIQGQHVTTLVRGRLPSGEYEFSWTPVALPSGIYLYQLQADREVHSRKLLYIK